MELRLGTDVACRAAHQASLADDQGKFIWSGWKFTTTTAGLEKLWAKVPDGAEVTAVMGPTRNAWVPLAAWLQAKRAKVVLVPPEQSADLRDYYNKHISWPSGPPARGWWATDGVQAKDPPAADAHHAHGLQL
ncbi:MAG: transposase [Actinomycetota bacterium]|nr:transposase [Actinomycetota bacterium]